MTKKILCTNHDRLPVCVIQRIHAFYNISIYHTDTLSSQTSIRRRQSCLPTLLGSLVSSLERASSTIHRRSCPLTHRSFRFASLAWSSTRDPAQVFTLLETFYKAFDDIASRKGIFKVCSVVFLRLLFFDASHSHSIFFVWRSRQLVTATSLSRGFPSHVKTTRLSCVALPASVWNAW